MSGARAETMKLVRKLRKQGFSVERTGSGHWSVHNAQGDGPVILAFSPRAALHPKSVKMLKDLGFKP